MLDFGLRFRIELGTHTPDLSRHRFGEIVRLRDAAGTQYPSTEVEELRGWEHHRAAILQFPVPASGTTRVDVLVRDVGGIRERIFRWDLQGPGPCKVRRPVQEPRMR